MPSGRVERERPCDRGGAGRGRGALRAADGLPRLIDARTARRAVAVLGGLLLLLAPVASARAADESKPELEGDASAPADGESPVADESGVETETSEPTPAHAGRPVPPAPLGTRFVEPLEGKQMRVRYQYTHSKYQGLLIGDRDAPPGYVRNDLYIPYVETPRALDVTTHLVEVAYAPHPRTTLALQIPFVQKDLETLEGDSGYRRKDQTDGVGDIAIALIVPFIRKGRESSHVHIAFDIPTGDIRKEDFAGNRLPYDSQLGNGTFDFEWGWTYRGEYDWLSWGGQATGRHALEENGLEYREGSRFDASLWGGVRLFAGLSASVRVGWQKQNNLHGHDRQFDKIVIANPFPPPPDQRLPNDPAENGKARGGTRFLVGPGLAYDFSGVLAGQRLAVELTVPVHQDLDGPQLEQDWTLTTGWQWAF